MSTDPDPVPVDVDDGYSDLDRYAQALIERGDVRLCEQNVARLIRQLLRNYRALVVRAREAGL